jgi:hypothetical protein
MVVSSDNFRTAVNMETRWLWNSMCDLIENGIVK